MSHLTHLQSKHLKKSGFVLGTGGSISQLLSYGPGFHSQFCNEVLVGCKQTHREFELDYWVSMDSEFNQREARAIEGKNFIGFVPCNATAVSRVGGYPELQCVPVPETKRELCATPTHFSELRNDADTGVIALRIAYLLGLNPIFVIGLNDSIHDGRLHYHNESRRITSEETVQTMGAKLREFVADAQAAGVQVVSCSPISHLNDLVPYRDVRDVLKEGAY